MSSGDHGWTEEMLNVVFFLPVAPGVVDDIFVGRERLFDELGFEPPDRLLAIDAKAPRTVASIATPCSSSHDDLKLGERK
jgi:hypothetical protein